MTERIAGMSIKTKASLLVMLAVAITSVAAMISASLLNMYQTRQANQDRLQKALESVQRQVRQQLASLDSAYQEFVRQPQNNYFLHNSIRMKYFLWQENVALFELRAQLHLERLAFYYPSTTDPSGKDRLYMFAPSSNLFIQNLENGKQSSIHINEFGAAVTKPLTEPVALSFPEYYVPGPKFALQMRDQQLLLIAHLELKRLVGKEATGAHIGYLVFEQPLQFDLALLNRELGVTTTIYDQQGQPGERDWPAIQPDTQEFSAMRMSVIRDTEQRHYDALVDEVTYDGARVGFLSVGIAQAETVRKIRQTIFWLSLLGCVVLLPTLLISSGMVTRFTRPILSLTRIATAMAQGDLRQEIPIEQRDEVGILAQSFSVMRDEIRRRIEELQRLNAELEQRVIERTAELARKNYILDAFLINIPASIYFKDRDSRIIRANPAFSRALSGDHPVEILGKSDFDFFPEELARVKFEQEQHIIQTGEALLNFEEFDTGGRWALTTKMPLRDEHGEIIGTFGFSNDITPLKIAQQQVEEAYTEIQMLNEQLQQENLRMSAELDIARRLQQMVLPMPQELTQIAGLEIVGYMQPAEEVGGDYYDVLSTALPGGISIGIGDVTGHGLESGVLMLMTQTAIRTLIDRGETDPVIFLNTLNRVLFHNIQRMGVDRSLTLAMVNYQDGQLRLIGQHEEALVVRADGRIERMDTIDLGFPIGMVDDIREWIAEATTTLAPGDGLVLYTDGITEAQNAAGDFYGLDRLCAVISQQWRNSTAEAVKEAIIDDVRVFVGDAQVYDDVTLVVLKQQ